MAVILGTVVSTFGIKGEIKVHSNTDFAKVRYQKNNKVILYSPIKKVEEEFTILSYRNNKNIDIVLLDGITSPEQAQKYVGYQVLINRDSSELDDGYYHYEDLYLCDVYYLDNKIGQVIDMINQTAHITLRIKRDGKKDLLYPFVDRFIKSVNVESKRIDLNPIEGMIE